MHVGAHLGRHVGSHLGDVGQGAATAPVVIAHGTLSQLVVLSGLLRAAPTLHASMAIVGMLRGTLTEIGPIMIELTGPLEVFRGDTLSYRLTVTDQTGARTNLTGYAIELEVKGAIGDPDPALIAKAVGAGVTLLTQTGDTKGQADIALTSDDTDIPAGPYKLDVVVSKDAVRTHVIEPRVFTVRGVVNAP